MSVYSFFGKKVKVDWKKILFNLKNQDLIFKFRCFRAKHRLSDNRCAYYVLKKHYSTIIKPGYVDNFMRSVALRYCQNELL